MKNLFTSESVSEGHPDKVADQISDAILDAFLKGDDSSHVAMETLVTTGQIVVAGEVTSKSYVDIPQVVRKTVERIGYTKSDYGFSADSCGILTAIHEQSPDICRGVSREEERLQGAGDQGLMFGYATNETETFMPTEHYLATLIVKTLADIRREGKAMNYLRPDAKSQVTIEHGSHDEPIRINTIVISAQHDDFASDEVMHKQISDDVRKFLIPRVKEQVRNNDVLSLFDSDIKYFVNPTGKFVIGGPAGDTGLTGRKIIVDTYGGKCPHGGGAFSGKDGSKVDRSAAYAARYIAKNLVANGFADKMQIQLAYAIGVAEPVSISVNTFGTHKEREDIGIAEYIYGKYDLTPYGIEKMLQLKNPIYEPTAAYGHFGRTPYIENSVTFFPWEKIE